MNMQAEGPHRRARHVACGVWEDPDGTLWVRFDDWRKPQLYVQLPASDSYAVLARHVRLLSRLNRSPARAWAAFADRTARGIVSIVSEAGK